MELKTDYRYHPESKDMMILCKRFEELLPNAAFKHKYVCDGLTKTNLIMIEAWDESKSKYYAQTLRDSQDPEDIAEKFYDVLK